MKNIVAKVISLTRRISLIVGMVGLCGSCTWIQRRFAPMFTEQGVHAEASQMSEERCLSCHREGLQEAPKAPEKMLKRKKCIRCHLKKVSVSPDSTETDQRAEDLVYSIEVILKSTNY